jgi:hypothetical protein
MLTALLGHPSLANLSWAAGCGTALMVQLDKLKAVLALLYEIDRLERARPPDRAEIDRLKAKLRELMAEDDDPGGATSL